MGGQLVTAYEVTHHLSLPDASPIGRSLVNGSTTSLRLTDLLPRVSYNVVVLGLIADLRGDPLVSVLSTRDIGACLATRSAVVTVCAHTTASVL